jgi:hypothetical protein
MLERGAQQTLSDSPPTADTRPKGNQMNLRRLAPLVAPLAVLAVPGTGAGLDPATRRGGPRPRHVPGPPRRSAGVATRPLPRRTHGDRRGREPLAAEPRALPSARAPEWLRSRRREPPRPRRSRTWRSSRITRLMARPGRAEQARRLSTPPWRSGGCRSPAPRPPGTCLCAREHLEGRPVGRHRCRSRCHRPP